MVVGAGFSGLAAAYELSQAGYEVTVVEARNRVGGRVISFSDLVPGKIVEGGGELIGSNHPAWIAYAKQFSLEFLDVRRGRPRVADRPRRQAAHRGRVGGALGGDGEGVRHHRHRRGEGRSRRAVAAANAEALDKRTMARLDRQAERSPLCKSALHTMMMADNGVVTEWQSYLGNLAMVKGGGLEKYWPNARSIAATAATSSSRGSWSPRSARRAVLTRMPVRAIAVTDRGARVTLGDGKVLEAEHVLLTAPPATGTGSRSIRCCPRRSRRRWARTSSI